MQEARIKKIKEVLDSRGVYSALDAGMGMTKRGRDFSIRACPEHSRMGRNDSNENYMEF